jgi:long-chain acyl-CoA synthetase
VGQGVWRIAAEEPTRPAIVEAGGQVRTYAEVAAAADRLAHGLRRLGMVVGDAVAAVLPNQATMLELQLATFQSGFYLVPVNTRLTASEIAYILADSQARAVVYSERFATAVGQALDSMDAPPPAFVADPAGAGGAVPELTAGVPDTRPDEPRPAGAAMHYTSGTTGRPKGVRRPLSGADADLQSAVLPGFLAMFGVAPHDGNVHLAVSPLYHTAPMTFSVSSVHAGHTVVLMDGWSPEETLRLIAERRVTTSHMVPTQFHRLLALPDEQREAADVSSLRQIIHAAAPCPVEDKHRMLEWWGPVVYEYYAATEGGGTLVSPQEWLERPGTVGRAWPEGDVRVLDDEGRPCPSGVAGTIWMSVGARPFEYYRDEEKTRAGRRDGYFTVGDIGYLDDAGYLFLRDRKADLIISGGVNIYPAEVEAALLGHPKVGDAAVFGIPDPDWGEQVKAVVEPASGATPGPDLEAELMAHCRERLAGYKCPRTIDFTDALPREPTGKLLKRRLRDPYWAGQRRSI